MKKLYERYNSISLILRILIGMVIGAAAGAFFPKAPVLDMLGQLFVGALKGIAPVLVLLLVMTSLANAKEGIGSKFRVVVGLYLLSTLMAAVVSVLTSFAFPVTLKLTEAANEAAAPAGVGEVLTTLVLRLVSNPVDAIMTANYIGILAWAVVLGLAVKAKGTDGTKRVLHDLSEAVSQVVRWVISFAPFGILGLVFTSVSTSGLVIFKDYGRLLILLVGTMALSALVVNPVIVAICLRRNPYPLVLRCLRESGITAFFTRSSAANIPINMDLCEKLGLDEEMYSVSIPLGATINMNGAAVTISIMALAAAHTIGITVDIPTAVILSVLSAISACGASGVAGGSLLLIPLACSLFGIGNDVAMQVVGVGFIVGVIQDSCETAINSSGDVIFAAVAEYMGMDRDKVGRLISGKEA